MKFLALLLAVTAILAGCNSSEPGGAQTPVTPDAGTANIEVRHILERAVPTSVDSFRFTGTDANGNIVFGPETRTRTATILLTGVPTQTRGFRIEYLSAGTVVGTFQTEVVLEPGQTFVIDNPDWVDTNTGNAATQLQFQAQPSVLAPGETFSLQVAALDLNGNPTGSTAAITLSGPNLNGTLTRNAVDGVAIFDGLSFATAGTFQIGASSEGLTPATSNPITVTSAPQATTLVFTAQPADAQTFLNPVTVQVVDQFGNPLAFSGPITIALGTNPSGASLQGAQVVNTVTGEATFPNLTITKPGTGFTLIASAPGLTPATSDPFNITQGLFARADLSLVVPAGVGLASTVDRGDFNGDGRTDAILADTSSDRIAVFTQTTDGDYTRSFLPITGLVRAHAQDLNGDGRADIVSVTNNAVVLDAQVWLSNGAGFDAPVNLALPGVVDVFDFVLEDVTADGFPDLVLSLQDGVGGALFTLVNTGSGAFPNPGVRSGLSAVGGEVVVASLVGSPAQDAAVTVGTDVQVLTGDGTGAFAFSQSLNVAGFTPTALAAGDLDGGQTDLVAYGIGGISAEVAVFLNNAGVFTQATGSPYAGPTTAPSGAPDQVAVGDFDADGRPDVVVVDPFLAEVGLYLNDPTPGNPLLVSTQTLGASPNPVSVVVADFNGDGNLDVGAGASEDRFVRLNGDGAGNLLPLPNQGVNTRSVAVGDLNGDGLIDLVASSTPVGPPSHLEVYLRQPDQTLPAVADFDITLAETLGTIVLADLDGNGTQDVVATDAINNQLDAYLNPGTGNYPAAASFTVPLSTVFASIATGDINGDGIPDFVANTNGSNGFAAALSTGPLAYTVVNQATTDFCQDVAVADLNGDGQAEVLTAEQTAGLGRYDFAGGVFNPTLTAIGFADLNTVGAGDLNLDGSVDVAVAAEDDGTNLGQAFTLLNDGGGALGAPNLLSDPGYTLPSQTLIADANGDGVNDILFLDEQAFGAAVLSGTGDGINFNTGISLIATGGAVTTARAMALLDLDGDGKTEPIFAVAGGTWISVLTLLALVAVRLALRRRYA